MCFGFCVQQFHWHSIGSCNRQHCHKLPLNILANLYQDETRRPTGHLPVTSCGHSVVASRVVTACVRKGFRGGKRAFHWLSLLHVGGILLLVANECICRLLCGSVGFAMRQCADCWLASLAHIPLSMVPPVPRETQVLGMVFQCWRDGALMHSWKPLPWLWIPATLPAPLLWGN